MILSKLEIHGFKSFAQKIKVDFNKGITAIVGPNGSGKSNIADAIRWVLGEQSAKNLRGTKMEDVIFSGSLSNRALAYCEVVLVFDNADRSIDLDFAQVSIMRRVYRSGESEYFINQTSCRLKDVVEIFRDTGVGKEGYSIISQGRVDEILSNKAQERRNVFEEAAGIAKFKSRKDEAEKKLQKTNENLVRIEDILLDFEANLETLAAQSEKAKTYLELKQTLKNVDISHFVSQYDVLCEKIKSTQSVIEQMQQQQQNVSRDLESEKQNLENQNELLTKLDNQIDIAQNLALDLATQATLSDGKAKVVDEKIKNIEQNQTNFQIEVEKNNQLIESYQKEIETISTKTTTTIGENKGLSEKIVQTQNLLENYVEKIKLSEQEIETQKNSIFENINKLSAAKVKSTTNETMQTSLFQRQETIFCEIQKLENEIIQIEKEHIAQKQACSVVEKDYTQNKILLENETNNLKNYELENEKQKLELSALTTQTDKQSSRLSVLKDMQNGFEGFFYSVKNLLKDCSNNKTLGEGIFGVVASLVRVPERFETAIETALGATMQNIVTTDEHAAKKAIEYLRSKNYGRATFLPLNKISSKTLSQSEKNAIASLEGVCGVASELVGFDEKYSSVIQNLLGRTVITTDLESAIIVARKTNNFLRVATLKGDIINAGGSMAGGSVAKKEYSLLGRDREISSLEQSINDMVSKINNLQNQTKNQTEKIQKSKHEIELFQKQQHAAELVLTRQKEKLEIFTKLQNDLETRKQNYQQESKSVQNNLEDIQNEIKALSFLQTNIQSGQSFSQKDVEQAQKALSEIREQREKTFEQLNNLKIEFANEENKIKMGENDGQRLAKQIEICKQNNENIFKTKQQDEILKVELLQQKQNLEEQTKSQTNDYQTAVSNKQKQEIEKESLREKIKTSAQANNDLLEQQKQIVETLHKHNLSQSKSEVEFETIQNQIWEEYNITYASAKAFAKDLGKIQDPKAQTTQTKNAIKLLGEVNVAAIEDYKSVLQRHTELFEQKNDLTGAKQDLEKIIKDLLSTMSERFSTQFELINQNFSKTFQELFGGGTAQLRLADGCDVLQSDIEIIAQPPGKKLQMLSLLSGGEKALTAIALLFSVLQLKPVPFCVLDEIEASLDEANVDNFAQYLKRYSEKTQFIVITHRKGSMAVCDSLYGVTMEGKGVSKLMSVNLRDFES